MAKSHLNVVMQGASGKIGKTLVFRQMSNGETVIANRSKPRTAPATPAEEATRERFINASYLAKKLQHDPTYGPQYQEKREPGKSTYMVAMADCLTSPKIKGIFLKEYTGAIGGTISVRAIDDFMVTSVKLRIFNAVGTQIEEGMANLDDIGLEWVYVATVTNHPIAGTRVEVTVGDIPGNETVGVVTII